MAKSQTALAGAGVCCCFWLVFLIVFLCTALKKVDQTEWCLKYNWWTESVDTEVYTEPGMKFVGMGNYLIPYPNYNMYVYFRDFSGQMFEETGDAYRPPLAVRTQDGLMIHLEMEFVYRLKKDKLRDLYMLVGEEGYENLLVSVSQGIIDNLATQFTAQQFYLDRNEMSAIFLDALAQNISSAGLDIELQTLQLQPAIFPKRYSQAIVDTLDAKQDIEVAEQEMKTVEIHKQTDQKKAEQNAHKIQIDAYRGANITVIENNIEISTFVYSQQKAAEGYSKAMEFFSEQGASVPSFMEYLNVRALSDHAWDRKTVQVAPVR